MLLEEILLAPGTSARRFNAGSQLQGVRLRFSLAAVLPLLIPPHLDLYGARCETPSLRLCTSLLLQCVLFCAVYAQGSCHCRAVLRIRPDGPADAGLQDGKRCSLQDGAPTPVGSRLPYVDNSLHGLGNRLPNSNAPSLPIHCASAKRWSL